MKSLPRGRAFGGGWRAIMALPLTGGLILGGAACAFFFSGAEILPAFVLFFIDRRIARPVGRLAGAVAGRAISGYALAVCHRRGGHWLADLAGVRGTALRQPPDIDAERCLAPTAAILGRPRRVCGMRLVGWSAVYRAHLDARASWFGPSSARLSATTLPTV